MLVCRICKKKYKSGNGTFFAVPKDEETRNDWSEICGIHIRKHDKICEDHFLPSHIVRSKRSLLACAVPFVRPYQQYEVEVIKQTVNVPAAENSENIEEPIIEMPIMPSQLQKNHIIEMPPQLQEESIIEMPIMPPKLQEESIAEAPVCKTLFCAASTQTNTRLCGLVEDSELAEEFHLKCFYCSEAFPLEKWKDFAGHLRKKHSEREEEFKTATHVSEDHDYTSIDLNASSPEIGAINSKSDQPLIVDPLNAAEEELELTEECEPDSIQIVQQKSTEIAFEYTPREIVELLLNSMKNYPVLWQFDDNPYNDDFYEAIEDLCKIMNDKWFLNIDHLKMRRSINRILRFYCYLYPNDNIEHIDQFTCYYDKCATFLPASINEIAYARCSHCYMCYRCDFDLKPHLLEEHKYLQWPYKCVQCKECFLQSDEYEFHKRVPHYDENFRCEPCNKTFFRRNMYTKHVLEKHTEDAEGEYKCDVCEKVFKHRKYLSNHKLTHGEKTHKCHLCPKSYINISLLRLHLKRHRRQYDYMCEFCGHKVFSITSLKVHMKKHTKEKITCNICNLKLRKSSLKQHLELRHVAYEGTIEQTLNGRHVNYRRLFKSMPFRKRNQNSLKKYECRICKMSFENQELVIEHTKELHPDVQRWSCKMCVMDFSFKRNLERHYRRRHKLERVQIYKLVEENEDLNLVLAYDKEQLDEFVKTRSYKNKQKNLRKSNIKKPMKSDLLDDEIYDVEDQKDISTIQDDIMNVDDNMKTEDYFFIEYLEEEDS